MNSDSTRHGWKQCRGQRGKLGERRLVANGISRYDLAACFHKACAILKNGAGTDIRDFKAFIDATDPPIPS